MKKFSFISKKVFSVIAVVTMCFGLSSCDVLLDVAAGMASYPTYSYGMASGYTSGYSSTYASTTSSSSPSSSSSYTSSHKTCSRCKGTANCQTCGGTGKKYDYGTQSLVTHEKYVQRCGVCRGTGRCGVCDGKGSI